jgi:CSLREA domain-containing protein
VSIDGAVGGRRRGALITALAVLACALIGPTAATAYTVDSTADGVDAVPGNEICLTAGGNCTLRAAIEEANISLGEFDEILFDEEVFDGQLGSTIALGTSLPAVVDRGFINGRTCATAAAVSGPCVGIDGPSEEDPALTVDHAEEVEIWGLAVTGAETAVSVDGSAFFTAQASWFGVALDGSVGGNGTGVLIGPGSNRALIGSEGSERGNVFAYNSGDGLDIHGANKARVFGNYFGVEKDGVTPAANGKDIEVTSVEGFEAAGTRIGTNVTFGSSATSPECDGGCNLISGSESHGIDLEGDGGTEIPAVATTIAGNYIGLNAIGAAAISNASAGIHVGRAVQTVIGGPKAGEANRINGGSVGVLAGPAAADLVVRGNLIGLDASGTESLAPPTDGIVINSEELLSQAVEAAIVDNKISAESGTAISQQGFGARIAGNEISGGETGIRAHGPTEEHGNLIEGNSVSGPAGNGILIESNLNEIFGNGIVGAGGAGIRIQGTPPFGVTENLIGGDTEDEENFISLNGGAAIEIANVEETWNEVARNRGIANGGPFIDLVALSPETEPLGPNDGIEPPPFTTATEVSASGSGAEAGANVRVFRKQLAEDGELESFLGEATADAGGNWEVLYGFEPVPAGTTVAATQTSEAGGTSELSTAIASGEPEGGGGDGDGEGGGGASSAPGNVVDTVSPQTKIVKAPKGGTKRRTARFRFESDESGSTFQCKLDGKPFRSCKSPKKYRNLTHGRHVFMVRAIDPAGNADSSPAWKIFTVIRRAGR